LQNKAKFQLRFSSELLTMKGRSFAYKGLLDVLNLNMTSALVVLRNLSCIC
jgi:hypothetical protein